MTGAPHPSPFRSISAPSFIKNSGSATGYIRPYALININVLIKVHRKGSKFLPIIMSLASLPIVIPFYIIHRINSVTKKKNNKQIKVK